MQALCFPILVLLWLRLQLIDFHYFFNDFHGFTFKLIDFTLLSVVNLRNVQTLGKFYTFLIILRSRKTVTDLERT